MSARAALQRYLAKHMPPAPEPEPDSQCPKCGAWMVGLGNGEQLCLRCESDA